MAISVAIVLSFVVRIYCFVVISIFTLLIDMGDLYECMPLLIKRLLDGVAFMCQKMDQKYCCGYLFRGRSQWKDDVCKRLVDRDIPEVLWNITDHHNGQQGKKEEKEETSKRRKNFFHMEAFQNVDWHKVSNYFTLSKASDEIGLHSKTVDHLIAVNFAFVMVHGEHKSLKVKNKSRLHKTTGKRNVEGNIPMDAIVVVNGDSSCAVANSDGVHCGEKAAIFRALQSVDGIEMVTATETNHHPREFKRQRSIQRKTSMKYFDDTEVTQVVQTSPLRPRIYSEADLEDFEVYGSDRKSVV
jgi:hypothetical protein